MAQEILQIGRKFNRLTVVKLDHIQRYTSSNGRKAKQYFYLCKCDCGKECIVMKQSLIYENTKSCGCINKERGQRGIHVTHNLTNTRIYKIREKMISRCYKKYYRVEYVWKYKVR